MPGMKIAYIGGLVWWFIAYMNHWGWTSFSLRDFVTPFYFFDWIAAAFDQWEATEIVSVTIWHFFRETTIGGIVGFIQPVLLAIAVWFILSRILIALFRRQLLFWKQFEVVLTRDDIGVGKRLGFTGIKRVHRHAFEKVPHRDRNKKKLATWHDILVHSGEVMLTFGPQSLRIADMYLNENMLEALQQQLLLLDRLVARA